MGNVSTTRRKNEKKMLQIKISTTKMNNAFNELISRLDMAKQGISEFKGISIETSQTKCKGKKEF